tara:strand:+ start:1591 stop:1785 length:195 start_codon:yes stop_codon:yes gene_type:complete
MSPNDYWNNWNSWEYYKNKDSVYEINKLAKSLAEISKQMSLVTADLERLIKTLIEENDKGGEEE